MANTFFMSVKGARQGDLEGETGKNRKRIPILGFSNEVLSPRDPTTGLPTGKRQHKPIIVTKEWGVISPQLYEALVANERLTSVIIDEIRAGPDGKESVYMEIRLTNASVVEIAIDPEQLEDTRAWTGNEIERVSFVFEKIEIDNKVSKAAVQDDWESGA